MTLVQLVLESLGSEGPGGFGKGRVLLVDTRKACLRVRIGETLHSRHFVNPCLSAVSQAYSATPMTIITRADIFGHALWGSVHYSFFVVFLPSPLSRHHAEPNLETVTPDLRSLLLRTVARLFVWLFPDCFAQTGLPSMGNIPLILIFPAF